MGLSYVIDQTEPRQVRLAGEIDLGVAGEAIDVITDAVLDGNPLRVVVDLSEVSRLDPAGVTALVTAARIAANRGCTLVVANPTPFVREVLATTGVLAGGGQPRSDEDRNVNRRGGCGSHRCGGW